MRVEKWVMLTEKNCFISAGFNQHTKYEVRNEELLFGSAM